MQYGRLQLCEVGIRVPPLLRPSGHQIPRLTAEVVTYPVLHTAVARSFPRGQIGSNFGMPGPECADGATSALPHLGLSCPHCPESEALLPQFLPKWTGLGSFTTFRCLDLPGSMSRIPRPETDSERLFTASSISCCTQKENRRHSNRLRNDRVSLTNMATPTVVRAKAPKVAFVAGSNGISGHAIVEYLIRQPEEEW